MASLSFKDPKAQDRAELLRLMDNYVKNHIDDEEIIYDVWFATGIPDEATKSDIMDIAKDCFYDTVYTFFKCCKLDELGD